MSCVRKFNITSFFGIKLSKAEQKACEVIINIALCYIEGFVKLFQSFAYRFTLVGCFVKKVVDNILCKHCNQAGSNTVTGNIKKADPV